MCTCEREEERAGGREIGGRRGEVRERWKWIGKGEIERELSMEKEGRKLLC